jgi:serine/threonine protein kinase
MNRDSFGLDVQRAIQHEEGRVRHLYRNAKRIGPAIPGYRKILWCIGKAVFVKGGQGLLNAASGGIAGDAWETVRYAWDLYHGGGKDRLATANLQELAQAPNGEIVKQAPLFAQEIAPDAPEEVRRNLSNVLIQVHATIRRTLRRPSDPTGTTFPPGFVLRQAEDLLPFLPTRISRFKVGECPLPSVDLELVELLGVGGFGEVWKARNPYQRNDPPVALKFCLNQSATESLRHEAALLDRVKSQGTHDGIVKLLRTYLRADPACLEYEYVEGGDLASVIQLCHRSSSGIPPHHAAKVMWRLTDIVGFAHRLDPPIVHRDLKPENVFVQKKADKVVLKIGDFGIGGVAMSQALAESCGTKTRALIDAPVAQGSYTLHYASPQQMAGRPADPRDDVFSLGVIWYQLLTGDMSKGRPGGSRWLERLSERGVTLPMGKLLESCFEEAPEDRPADARVLYERLNSLLAGPQSTAVSVAGKGSLSKSKAEPSAKSAEALDASTTPKAGTVNKRRSRSAPREVPFELEDCDLEDLDLCLDRSDDKVDLSPEGYFELSSPLDAPDSNDVSEDAPDSDGVPADEIARNSEDESLKAERQGRRLRGAILGLVVGTIFGVIAGTTLRAIFGVIAWPLGWEMGGWLEWMKWGTVVGMFICTIVGWNPEDNLQGLGGAIIGLVCGSIYGVCAGTILRVMFGLIAWPFGWEMGGWLEWMKWGAVVGAFIGSFVGWSDKDNFR